jgi:hypothetical protein
LLFCHADSERLVKMVDIRIHTKKSKSPKRTSCLRSAQLPKPIDFGFLKMKSPVLRFNIDAAIFRKRQTVTFQFFKLSTNSNPLSIRADALIRFERFTFKTRKKLQHTKNTRASPNRTTLTLKGGSPYCHKHTMTRTYKHTQSKRTNSKKTDVLGYN